MIDRLLGSEPDPIADGGYGLRVLEVAGRRSGVRHRTPVGQLVVDGTSYLVSPDRTRDWPANVAAAQHCTILAGSERAEFRAEPLSGLDAARIVSRYLSVVTAPWAISAFRVDPEAAPSQLVDQVDRMAVFALSPVD